MKVEREIPNQEQSLGRLRKILKDKLGTGIWGLKKENQLFTHEEILFLFSRIFQAFGIDYIKEIRTSYPDCICIKDNKEYTIEFESLLSTFRNHINNDDLSKCNCIICWEDDLDRYNNIRLEIDKNNIEVIELKRLYEENKIKDRFKSYEWNRKDFESLSKSQLLILKAFIVLDSDILSSDKISDSTGIRGRALGGPLGNLKHYKEALINKHPDGWQLNRKYRDKIIEVLRKFKYI